MIYLAYAVRAPTFAVLEYVFDGQDIGLGRYGAERNRRERQLSEWVCSLGVPHNSQPGDLVVLGRWSGFCNRAGYDLSSRRLAEGARIRQADSVGAAFLRGTNRSLRHRTFHGNGGHHVDHAGVDSVASVLGVPGRHLLYRSHAEPGDRDSGASLSDSTRLDIFPFRSVDARPGLGTKSA